MELATARLDIAKLYLASFNRVADTTGLDYWTTRYMNGETLSDIAQLFTGEPEYKAKYPAIMTEAEYVAAIYSNVFGRTADAAGQAHWESMLANGTATKATLMNWMVSSALNDDALRLANQAEFAVQSVLQHLDPVVTSAQLASITANAASVQTALTGSANGETYTLTAGADTITGAAGADTFTVGETFLALDSNDDPVYRSHLNASDVIDGAEGTDTMNIASESAIATVAATVSGVETINLRSGAGVTFDTTTYTGVETLNVTQAGAATSVTAATTTDINVSGAANTVTINSGKNVVVTDSTASQNITIGATTVNAGTITVTDTKQGTGAIAIDGGTNVTVTATATELTGTITVGDTTNVAVGVSVATDVATGAINVTQNLVGDGTGSFTGGAIKTEGGSTVNITVNANSTATGAATNDDITVGAITVNGSDVTTTVTVTQNDNAVTFTSAEVAEVADREVVTFVALATGESVTVDGLTFTASKALTAAEVAAAFVDLTVDDTQDNGGKVANGTYTGAFDTTSDWTSAAASGATVTFTGTDSLATAMTISDTAAAGNVTSVATAGTAASGGVESTNVTVLGAVAVSDSGDDTMTTVTVNGYAGSTIASDALTTLTLINSAGTMNVDVDADNTFALTVNDVLHAVSLDAVSGADITDLTINAATAASTFALTAAAVTDLTINAAVALDLSASTMSTVLETVDVNGAGAVDLGDISGAVTLNTFDASGNTGGVTATIETEIAGGAITGDITEYIFSEGNDVVTLSNDVIETKVTLGAGDDTLTLAAATGIADVVATLNGGTGTNIIAMAAADAEILSGDATFEGKMSNFSKLSLAAVADAATNSVDLANMDNISYVISAGTAGATETGTYTFGALLDGQSITVAGVKVQAIGGGLTDIQVAEAFDSAANGATPVAGHANAVVTGTLSGWSTANNAAATVVFTSSTVASNVADLDTTDSVLGIAAVLDVNGIQGVNGDAAGAYETATVVLGALAAGQSYTVVGIKIQAVSALTATQVGDALAAAFSGGTSTATYLVSGAKSTPTNWGAAYTVANVGGTLTFTNATDANIATTTTDFDAIGNTIVAAPAVGAQSAYTQGAGGALALTNMANSGTLELTAAGTGATVTMTDATGTADTFNIVITSEATTNVGAVTVDDVETIAVTTNDAFTDDGVLGGTADDGIDDADAVHTLAVDADSATAITVAGAGDITITTTSTVLETLNATNLTGKLTFIAALDDLVVTGGSAADTLTADADSVTLNGGNGANTFTVNAGADLVTLTGGTGVDTFNIAGASTTESTYAIISAVTSGDTIKFTGADSFASAAITLSPGATVTSQALMDKAINDLGANDMGWFTYNGNTFIVMDAGTNGAAGFVDAEDMVIMISGTVDLSTASYNSTSNTIEIA